MRRMHLVESVDLPWCPQAVRDGITDWVRFMYNTHKAFGALAPKLRHAMERVGTDQIVDMCSGGGGPWLTLEPVLAESGRVQILLTDFYPNIDSFRYTLEKSRGHIRFHPEPVDATKVPAELQGVRTLMNAFHHFRPEQAQSILADAVQKRRAIVVVEGTDHRLFGILIMMFMPISMLLLMPRVEPFRWSRLFFTYVLPVLPALSILDGTVSMLRTYNPEELREMVARIPGHESFDWDIGTQPIPHSPIGFTYLVGIPRERGATAGAAS